MNYNIGITTETINQIKDISNAISNELLPIYVKQYKIYGVSILIAIIAIVAAILALNELKNKKNKLCDDLYHGLSCSLIVLLIIMIIFFFSFGIGCLLNPEYFAYNRLLGLLLR